MYKYLKINKIFTILSGLCLALFLCIPLCGCKYGAIVNLSEQIAIYQNMGFTKIEPTEELIKIDNIELSVNTKDQINAWLKINQVDANVNDFVVLGLVKDGLLDGLLYIYYLDSCIEAKNFYNTFKSLQNNMRIIDSAVIQKGYSDKLASSATNHYYFLNFCKGIKK